MDASTGGPKFPGELSDHLPQQGEPPDRLADRLRHAWFWYAILAVAIPAWVGAMVAAIVFIGGPLGWLTAMIILFVPIGVYRMMLFVRFLSSRDPATGERLNRRDR